MHMICFISTCYHFKEAPYQTYAFMGFPFSSVTTLTRAAFNPLLLLSARYEKAGITVLGF